MELALFEALTQHLMLFHRVWSEHVQGTHRFLVGKMLEIVPIHQFVRMERLLRNARTAAKPRDRVGVVDGGITVLIVRDDPGDNVNQVFLTKQIRETLLRIILFL